MLTEKIEIQCLVYAHLLIYLVLHGSVKIKFVD